MNANLSSYAPEVAGSVKSIAAAFLRLQQNRQTADYDNATRWARVDVLGLIDLTSDTFESWRAIQQEALAQHYLLSLLVKDRP